MSDKFGALFAKPLPELVEILLLTPFHYIKQFRATRSFQRADHRPVVLPMAHRNLVCSQHRNPVQDAPILHLLQRLLINSLYRVTVQNLKNCHRLDCHNLAKLKHQTGKLPGHPGTSDIHKIQSLSAHPTLGTVDPISSKPEPRNMLPPQKMLNLLLRTIIACIYLLPTTTAPIITLTTLQIYCYSTMTLVLCLLYSHYHKSLYPQNGCDIFVLHPVVSPLYFVKGHFSRKFTLPDAFFLPTLSRHEA